MIACACRVVGFLRFARVYAFKVLTRLSREISFRLVV